MAELKRVYWDANCWLGFINREPAKLRAVEYIYNAARAGAYELWTSTMSYVEVYRLAEEVGKPKPLPQVGLDTIEEMFGQDFVKLVPVDMEIGINARRLIREVPGLGKKPDAIHLASALRWNVDALHTYDNEDLLHLDGKLKCKSGAVLRICEPDEQPDGPLFAQKTDEKPPGKKKGGKAA